MNLYDLLLCAKKYTIENISLLIIVTLAQPLLHPGAVIKVRSIGYTQKIWIGISMWQMRKLNPP